MNNRIILSIITFTLAFCSIAYELILAQALSAFLENTVLRYSVTIGLYMFSLGVGSLLAEGKVMRVPVLSLLRIEILLTLIGGSLIVALHTLDSLGVPRIVFSTIAHGLIILIGILSGFEIPLLIALFNKNNKNDENTVLAINYIGAFLGTIIFAFVFYPKLGLMPTAFLVAVFNGISGMLLFTLVDQTASSERQSFHSSLLIQGVVLVGMLVCFVYANQINHYFIQIYIQ